MHNVGYLFKEGIKSLWKNRTMSFASIAVLISCLLMTGVAGLLSISLSMTMKSIEGNNTISVFLNNGLPALSAVKVGEELKAIENVDECTFVSKDDGLVGLMESLEAGSDLLEGLQGDNNPLPDSYNISLLDLSKYEETLADILAVEGVAKTTDYRDVANKLSNLDVLVRYCSIGIVALLSVVSLFIIVNTVKVTMFSRRVEIIIMKSVGATNGFVRVPFIVEGLIIGLLSGAISATIIYFAYSKAVEIVYSIVPFISAVDLEPYTVHLYVGYIIAGMLFGIMGGVISIGKYLKKEGENAVV